MILANINKKLKQNRNLFLIPTILSPSPTLIFRFLNILVYSEGNERYAVYFKKLRRRNEG